MSRDVKKSVWGFRPGLTQTSLYVSLQIFISSDYIYYKHEYTQSDKIRAEANCLFSSSPGLYIHRRKLQSGKLGYE